MSCAYKMTDPEGCLTHQLQTGGSGGGRERGNLMNEILKYEKPRLYE